MENNTIRAVKINITRKLTLDERIKLKGLCREAKRVSEFLELRAKESGECLGTRIYKENEEEINKEFKLLHKSAITQMAMQIGRRLFAPRAAKREIKEEIPLNRGFFKIFKHGSQCVLEFGNRDALVFDMPIPEHFTRKYMFNKADYKWARLEIENGEIYIFLFYDILLRNENNPQLTFAFAH